MSLKAFLSHDPDSIAIIKRFQQQAPVDVVALANELGVSVWEDDLGTSVSGKLFRDAENGGPSGYSIVVHEPDAYVRKRFTIAHEIAHFLLHRRQVDAGIQDDVFYRSTLSDRTEAEANRFAAEILMPANLIQEVLDASVDVRAAAARLGVSETALKIRMGLPT